MKFRDRWGHLPGTILYWCPLVSVILAVVIIVIELSQ